MLAGDTPHAITFERGAVGAIVVLTGAQFVLLLDSSIVTIALPTLERSFGVSRITVQWVMTAYVLPFGGFMVLGGRLADSLGRRRLFRGRIANLT